MANIRTPKINEPTDNKTAILNAIRDSLKPFGNFQIDSDVEDQYDDGGITVDILDDDGFPAAWISKAVSRKGADYLCTAIEAALKNALEKYGCEVSTDGEGDMVYAYVDTSAEDESKKKHEGLRDLKTFKKDLVYVPEFANEKALADLVVDIHDLFKDGEEGWDGDAHVAQLPAAMALTDFPYLIAIGGSDTLFAFQSKSDRDCILNDYLRDPDLLG